MKTTEDIFYHILTLFFCSNGQLYEQIDGVAIGSPLLPVIANFFMGGLSGRGIQQDDYKPMCWFWYGNNTFIVWPHGTEKVHNFLNHLNSIHPDIQFIIENESDGYLSFLYIDLFIRLSTSRWKENLERI
jgi:hypothetical protein